MKATWAILSILFFHVIVVESRRGTGPIGVLMVEAPPAGVALGIPMALTVGPCFGVQTSRHRRVCLTGVILLLLASFAATGISGFPGVTAFTSIPFWACSLVLLVLRIRENPQREAAEKEARLQAFKARLAQIRASLSKQ